ncbi:hypothetical protein P168DRAFT_278002 [Aspergillus campestris IBT 28561]|uniref:Uncharacterized protein n=1 Tax=Aspergillus campestris (strain IBT 28561) TaxID=1392248 RepID=A0A2I1DEY3_ASPC2|nr:uncharacterized protein P168DRAFT_278002 [Aspergillus campestris IBT 28561]PKY08410.1 hypothetical protein P168DRAFT_278002 [Aspergillus campestris IBT 28561]
MNKLTKLITNLYHTVLQTNSNPNSTSPTASSTEQSTPSPKHKVKHPKKNLFIPTKHRKKSAHELTGLPSSCPIDILARGHSVHTAPPAAHTLDYSMFASSCPDARWAGLKGGAAAAQGIEPEADITLQPHSMDHLLVPGLPRIQRGRSREEQFSNEDYEVEYCAW